MIIDAHCHVWPDEIAAKVLGARPVGLNSVHDGTLDGLRKTLDEAGIDMALTLAVANVGRTVWRTNEFVGKVDRTRFIPFGTVHPELSIDENLRALRDNGIVGVKLHTLFQSIDFAESQTRDILVALAENDVPVISHVGSGGDEEQNRRGAPAHLRALVADIPGLRFIAAHFGGYHVLDEAEKWAVGADIHLETSWPPSMGELSRERIVGIVRRHGTDRVVYGSDWPMTDPAAEITAIKALGLTADEERGILGENLARLLRIDTTSKG
ncbi:amidohydrolase family protein [Microbacterium trichothecenolyticum]|uniref:Amidohydrolase n=1 Tax=Microbacterium trichothecenolyticum TaxID=69370 RepID=A0A0M2HDL3_MICTR|nr:amidohydrolase family protein [Microbacterium trichothecenolyticum]KJL42321.1 Amidohydrolase [Microbacterium trichothecenolyticum]